jgi:hypothetical protein
LGAFALLGRWVRADPAAVLEALPVLLLRSTFDAAVPAFLPVVSPFGIVFATFLNAEPVADLAESPRAALLRLIVLGEVVFTETGGRLGMIC